MLNEFKKFLIKGNAVDMAVGFIFGAAFATLVKSFITNIIMPPIGVLMGKVDFSELVYVLIPAKGDVKAVTIKYGIFINDFIAFLTLGFVVFMMVRFINKLQKPQEEKPAPKPEKSEEVKVLEKILKAVKK